MVTDLYPPAIGGMERHVQLLVRGLSRTNNEVILCMFGSRQRKLERQENTRSYSIEGAYQKLPFLYKSQEKSHPPIADPLLIKRIAEIVKLENPDIIHCHNWISFSVLRWRRKSRIPLVVSLHDFGFICPQKYSSRYTEGICSDPLNNKCLTCGRDSYNLAKSMVAYQALRLSRHTLNDADALLYSTPNLLYKMGDLRPNKFYLPNPIDTDLYRPLNVDSYESRVLCWVKLQRAKGVDTIFRVATLLPEIFFDVAFVGDDKDCYACIKPGNVKLIPSTKRAEIPRLLNRYPIILGQFHIGAIGMAELEAMSCGRPVVAYWDRKYDSFYDEPCPILSSRNASEIASMIGNHIGDEKLGMRCREWVIKGHSFTHVTSKLQKIYARTLDSR